MAALAKGNRHRSARAELKRSLKGMDRFAAERTIAKVVADPSEALGKMKLADLLLACPKWGEARTARLLVRCHVSADRTLGGLSERQREAVVGELGR